MKGTTLCLLFLVLSGCSAPSNGPDTGGEQRPQEAVAGFWFNQSVALMIAPAEIPDVVADISPNCIYIDFQEDFVLLNGTFSLDWIPQPTTQELRLVVQHAGTRFGISGPPGLAIVVPEDSGALDLSNQFIQVWGQGFIPEESVPVRQEATLSINLQYQSSAEPTATEMDSCGSTV